MSKTDLRPLAVFLSSDRSKTVLLQFFVCASVVSCVAFVLSLFIPRLSFFWCLGKAVLRDCSISWVSSLIFVYCDVSLMRQRTLYGPNAYRIRSNYRTYPISA